MVLVWDRKTLQALLVVLSRVKCRKREATMLYALCGLSGSGKTTLLEAVLQQRPDLARLVKIGRAHV